MAKIHAATWRRRNPLRVYLESRHDATITEIAAEIGCSRPMLYLWMNGACRPTMASMEAIRGITGITWEEWAAWVQENPAIKRKGTKC